MRCSPEFKAVPAVCLNGDRDILENGEVLQDTGNLE